jgi:glycosyltransferase involved in cell wall biosynthesis
MRIQMVCQFGLPVRGLSPYADALLEHLSDIKGLEVEKVDFSAAYPRMLHPAEQVGVKEHGELHWARPWTWLQVARRSADLMHIQHWAAPLSLYLWPLAAAARRHGKRVLITVHNPAPHEKAGIFRMLEDRLLRSADGLLVHGNQARDHILQRLGANAPPVHVVPHGLNPLAAPGSATADDYRRVGLSPRLRYVLIFGNLRGYKGVDLLLAAWRIVRSELEDVALVIAGRLWNGRRGLVGRLAARLIGTADEAARLEAMLGAVGQDDRMILREGFQSDQDIDALIRISALAVFPYSKLSGQSGAACRAAAMGCPVLVGRVGALPDLAIDDSWTLVPGDENDLARRLIEKMQDPSTTASAAFRQLLALRDYDWRKVARSHMELYRSLA